MAFKATVSSAEQAFDMIRKVASGTKQFLQQQRALMVSPQCEGQTLVNVIQHCGTVLQLLAQLVTTPGLTQYARDQFADQTYDISAEYQAMRAALINCRDGMMSAFPKDASGYLLHRSFDANGIIVQRMFTAAQVSSGVTLMDAVIAAIE